MIIVFFGQPHSGKTTLATEFQRQLFILERASYPIIDGDKDYSREGRIKNLNRISDISTFLAHQYRVVMVSAVYPIKEAREYFESIHEEVIWVYLTYNETRGREGFHVEDFNEPEELKNLIKINTTENGIQECIEKILPVYWAVSGSPRGSQVPVQEQN
jgi:tRNA uridine 5-carbamoylmethylation protein Kti12